MSSKLRDLICPNPKCKGDIHKPILLTDFSKTPAESYYACPRCMTKLNVNNRAQKAPAMVPITAQEVSEEEKEETSEMIRTQRTEEEPVSHSEPAEEETPTGCPHYFGYLSRRPQNASIPEECLTCREMIKCMLKLRS